MVFSIFSNIVAFRHFELKILIFDQKTLTASQNINTSKETIIHPTLLIYYAYAVM